MRPSTSSDRNRIGLVSGLVLATFLAVGPRALGDDPEPPRPDPIIRGFNRFERVVDVFWAVADGVLNPPKNPWLDKAIVLKSLKIDLRVDGRSVPMPGGRVFHKFQVKRIEKDEKGERLWLVDGPLKGWVDASEVVLEDEALSYFSDQIGRGSSTAETYYLRGSLSELGGLADLAEAIRLDPKFAAAYAARASVYSEKKDNDRALADLTEAIRLDPALAVAYSERASIHEERKDTGHALADLAEAIRLDPGDASNHAARGQIHSEAKDWAPAVADLTEAIRLTRRDEGPAPDFSTVHWFIFGRGEAYRNLADYDRAIADYTEAIRLAEAQRFLRDDSMIFVALCNRADARDSKKDYDGAIADLNEAIDRAPKEGLKAAGLTRRAGVRKHRKDVDGAIADYAEALRVAPEDKTAAAVSYVNRGQIESDRNDLEAALADCSKAVLLLPTNPVVYVCRSRVLSAGGRYERALADCDQAVEIGPKDSWGHDFRAWIRATCPEAKFRDGKKAVEGATRACELSDWKNPSCLETLAAAEAESGDFDAAVKWQARALELVKDDEVKPRFRERLELFGKKQPYRDTPPAVGDRRASHPMLELPLTAR